MKDDDLIDLLEELAIGDLVKGSKLKHHPCSLAVKRINDLKLDLKDLKRCAETGSKSKRCCTLMGSSEIKGY